MPIHQRRHIRGKKLVFLLGIPTIKSGPSPFARTLHAPDGFFSLAVSSASWGVAAIVIVAALKITGARLNERMVPALGVFAAFIFAAQMFNFPVAGGTSGHLIGAALAAIVLGPWAAIIVMSAVVSLQALMFQDGGLVVMGVNLINMAILPTFVAYLIFTVGKRLATSQTSMLILAGVAAWLSVEAGAVGAALQLSISGTSPLSVSAPAMIGVHALIGIGEALITAGALAVVFNSKRELFRIGKVVPETVAK